MEIFDTPLTLRMLRWRCALISIQIKPIMIGSTTLSIPPGIFCILWVIGQSQIFVRIRPSRKTMKTIWIIDWVDAKITALSNKSVIPELCSRRQIIGNQNRSISAARLISMNRKPLINHNRHLRNIHFGGQVWVRSRRHVAAEYRQYCHDFGRSNRRSLTMVDTLKTAR